MDRIGQLFDLLDDWRHLPAYQLERRADILFALYLPDFLSDYLKLPIRSDLIPEFPVLPPNAADSRSCRIDYVAMSKDKSQIIFVELKTDGLSRRDRQDDYLLFAQRAGMERLVRDLLRIFETTASRAKYCSLLRLVESQGLVALPPGFYDRAKQGWRGFRRDLAAARVPPCDSRISVYYLQPRESEANEIGFDRLASWLDQLNEPLAERFARSLRHWSRVVAGDGLSDD